MADKHQVLVYGTLRPFTNTNIVRIPGHLYDLGSFPGLKLDNSSGTMVTCEVIEVTDEQLKMLDRYECYWPDSPEDSLYIRRKLDWGPFVYEYNGEVYHDSFVPSGDWEEHLEDQDREPRSMFHHFLDDSEEV